MNNIVQRITSNKHTSGAAIVYAASKFACYFGVIWFPHYKDQFTQTADLVESTALGYGLLLSGTVQQSQQEQTKQ